MNHRNQKQRPWFRILRDLMKAEISMSMVARACGRTTKTVCHWGDGGDPKDLDARIVLALYRKHCPDLYMAHIREFEPDLLQVRQPVTTGADRSIRGRPRPRRVVVFRVTEGQRDLFEGVV